MLNTLTSERLDALNQELLLAKRIAITTHHNPDGDALGSALGLYHILKGKGYNVTVVTTNSFPSFLTWLPEAESIVKFSHNPNQVQSLFAEADLVFCLDFNAFARTEKMSDTLAGAKGKKVLIDHHPFPESTFDLSFSQTEVSSTCELVFEIFSSLWGDEVFNRDAAICLYTGIMTDTGSFSYACNRGETFAIAGKLVAKGVQVGEVQDAVYNNFSADRMRLMGYALADRMRVFPEHHAAYISLTKEELARFSYKMGDTEGIVNLPLSVSGVIFSALFTETDELVKVSLRSKGNFPANEVASAFFNGGGHTNAAGGKSFLPLADTEVLFQSILEKYKKKLCANAK